MAGGGLGWLMGLSTTPVVAGVITALMTSAAAILGALGGVQSESGAAPSADAEAEGGLPPWNTRINPLPLAFLALGIVVGSIFGLRARNLNWLGSDVANEMQIGPRPVLISIRRRWPDACLRVVSPQHQLQNQEWLSRRDAAEISKTLAAEVAMWESLG